MSLYLEAASILESPQTTSLKSIIYNPSKPFKSPQSKLYALIVETLKFQDILKEVVENAGILTIERKLTPLLSILLVHDLLLAKSGIAASNGPLKDAVMRHKARLNAEFTRIRIKHGHPDVKSLKEAVNAKHGRESEDGVSTSSSGLTTFSPRWIRVNTLKTTTSEALASPFFGEFQEVGGTSDMFFFPTVQKHYCTHHQLLPNVFSIHPSHNVTSSDLYKSGAIILQSGSSCLPAVMLNPPQGATVIDGCAAPGNKTTHLAAIVGPTGKIFAVERDKNRAEILERMTKRAGADGLVKILKATDFTTIKEGHEAWNAEYLLLDPSCSGSGILQRIDWDITKLNLPSANESSVQTSKNPRKRKRQEAKPEIVKPAEAVQDEQTIDEETPEQDTTKERLQGLSDFQLAIILHAFSFPKAKRITYSTCSIHAEENEHVVVRALNSDIARELGWKIQSRKENPLDSWYRRGIPAECSGLIGADDREKERVAEGCVRVNRTDSLGGGFFVACFVREGDVSNSYATKQNPADLSNNTPSSEADEWEGFSENEEAEAVNEPVVDPTPKKQKKTKKSKKENDDGSKNGDGARANSRFLKGKKGW